MYRLRLPSIQEADDAGLNVLVPRQRHRQQPEGQQEELRLGQYRCGAAVDIALRSTRTYPSLAPARVGPGHVFFGCSGKQVEFEKV